MSGTNPINVLFLDHEGGWGGASRSLWYLISNLDRDKIAPTVWHRQQGPATDRLKSLNIPAVLVPELPNITPESAGHPGNWIANFRRLAGMPKLAQRMRVTKADIIHFNYEGIAPLAWFLARQGDSRQRVLHVRALNPPTIFTRLFVKHIAPLFDYVIFITENERDSFVRCGFDTTAAHSVLHNPTDRATLDEPYCEPPSKDPFRVSFFGTIDVLRGADRLIDVARLIKQRTTAKIEINLFGRGPRYRKWLIVPRKNEEELQGNIKRAGVADIVRLRGHTASPETEMLNSNLVIRTSRGSDPWGRDVIEAMSLGRPVIATGKYNGFIKPDETGFLIDPWDASEVADYIVKLAENPTEATRLGMSAKTAASRLFAPSPYASKVSSIYSGLVGRQTPMAQSAAS